MSNNVTLPGTGVPVETLDVGGGVERQVITISPRDLSTGDSIGPLTESAPASDTASSGLNGRLQRIAQRLTSMMAMNASSALSFARTADTNAYAGNDVIGTGTGSGAAVLTFANVAANAGQVMITSARLEIDDTAVISGETSYRLYLYDASPASAFGDNTAFDLPSGDRANFMGYVDLGTPVDIGSTLYVETNIINKQLKAASTSLFGYLVTNGGYTPTSARTYKITLHTIAG
jgi:hypothetical protein